MQRCAQDGRELLESPSNFLRIKAGQCESQERRDRKAELELEHKARPTSSGHFWLRGSPGIPGDNMDG